MKTGNLILDKALQAQKGAGEIEIVRASFYENPISYGELKGIKPHLVNYTYINLLLKDYEAAYNHWNKAVGILEKIADPSEDYNKQKIDGLKEQLFWLKEKGQDARDLNGMIKDMIIYRTGNYEAAPGAQQKINEVYSSASRWYKLFVEKIEQLFISAAYHASLKDTRPLIEKLSTVIDLQPEQASLFTNGITNHAKPGLNLQALEINILMQLSSSTLQSYFTNEEDPEMIRQLQAQLEQMRQERDNAVNLLNNSIPQLEQLQQQIEESGRTLDTANQQRDEAIQQVEDRDRIIEEQGNRITELTDTVNDRDTQIDTLNNTVQDLQNTIINKDNQINELNTTVKDLHEANIDSSPQIRNLEHRLEVVNIEKSALEQILAIREQQITGLQHDKIVLEQSATDLKEDKAELRTAKNELTAKNLILEQIKDQLNEGIGNLRTEVATKDSKIEKIMTCYTDYETIMLGCSTCQPHVHAIEFD